MLFFVGELYDLVFNRRTIARADRPNLSAIHRRTVHVLADDAPRFFRGPHDVARNLRVVMCDFFCAKTEGSRIGIAGLFLKTRPVYGAAIEPWRSAGLQTAATKTK